MTTPILRVTVFHPAFDQDSDFTIEVAATDFKLIPGVLNATFPELGIREFIPEEGA